MRESICNRIDGYLGRWLSESERAEFETHLVTCARCRHVVREQEHIDRLLTAAAAPVPPLLIDRTARRLQRARQRRLIAWSAGLAAAALLVYLLADRFLPRPVDDRAPPVVEIDPPGPPSAPPSPIVQVTFAKAN